MGKKTTKLKTEKEVVDYAYSFFSKSEKYNTVVTFDYKSEMASYLLTVSHQHHDFYKDSTRGNNKIAMYHEWYDHLPDKKDLVDGLCSMKLPEEVLVKDLRLVAFELAQVIDDNINNFEASNVVCLIKPNFVSYKTL